MDFVNFVLFLKYHSNVDALIQQLAHNDRSPVLMAALAVSDQKSGFAPMIRNLFYLQVYHLSAHL